MLFITRDIFITKLFLSDENIIYSLKKSVEIGLFILLIRII